MGWLMIIMAVTGLILQLIQLLMKTKQNNQTLTDHQKKALGNLLHKTEELKAISKELGVEPQEATMDDF